MSGKIEPGAIVRVVGGPHFARGPNRGEDEIRTVRQEFHDEFDAAPYRDLGCPCRVWDFEEEPDAFSPEC